MLPTRSPIFRRGDTVKAIYGVDQGLVELSDGPQHRIRYGPGEIFFYEDMVDFREHHTRDAIALTPVALIRLDRLSFLALIHRHPTLVLQLLVQQHGRLRQQRLDARHVY